MAASSSISTARISPWLIAIFLLAAVFTSVFIQYRQPRPDTATPTQWGDDIDFIWFYGAQLRGGVNPYARIVDGDMHHNQKYATYFPISYLAAAGSELVLVRYDHWLLFWRGVFFLFYLAIGAVVFFVPYRQGQTLLALFCLLFWLYNRWTLDVLGLSHIDFLPLLFLLLSVLSFERGQRRSLWWLSASLAVKHIAAVVVPLYLIRSWQETPGGWKNKLRGVFGAGAVMAAIPVVTSIPFLIWGARAFVQSILFSVTRYADSHFPSPSFDMALGQKGLSERTMISLLLVMLYLLFWDRRLSWRFGVLLTLVVFIDFNPVLYRQYMCWTVPFLLIVLWEFSGRRRPSPDYSAPVETAGP